jgi:hypothetical protein
VASDYPHQIGSIEKMLESLSAIHVSEKIARRFWVEMWPGSWAYGLKQKKSHDSLH